MGTLHRSGANGRYDSDKPRYKRSEQPRLATGLLHRQNGEWGLPEPPFKFKDPLIGKWKPAEITAKVKKHVDRGGLKKAEELLIRALERYGKNEYFYAQLIEVRGKKGDIAGAKEVFDLAISTKGLGTPYIYCAMIGAYYENQKFRNILKFISTAPEKIRQDSKIRLKKIEALRKLKEYDRAIPKCKKLMADENAEEEQRVGAKVALAYCYEGLGRNEMEKGMKEKAAELHGKAVDLLWELEIKVPKDGPHRARVLCGLVFMGAIGGEKASRVEEELRQLKDSKKGHIIKDVDYALEVISEFKKKRGDGAGLAAEQTAGEAIFAPVQIW